MFLQSRTSSSPVTVTVTVTVTVMLPTLDSFVSGMKFLFKLTRVKSLSIHLPSSFRDNNNPRCCLFKWKARFGYSRVESVIFLAPNSICDKEGFYVDGSWIGEEERGLDILLINQKFGISLHCMKEVVVWHKMLLHSIKDLPMLERVSITDLGTRGGRVSLSGDKLRQMKRECVDNPSLNVKVSHDVSYYFVPKLKLPVSGCVMKGIYIAVMEVKDLQGGNATTGTEEDGFEQDNEEEADVYSEAMKEFLEKHMDRMMHVVVV